MQKRRIGIYITKVKALQLHYYPRPSENAASRFTAARQRHLPFCIRTSQHLSAVQVWQGVQHGLEIPKHFSVSSFEIVLALTLSPRFESLLVLIGREGTLLRRNRWLRKGNIPMTAYLSRFHAPHHKLREWLPCRKYPRILRASRAPPTLLSLILMHHYHHAVTWWSCKLFFYQRKDSNSNRWDSKVTWGHSRRESSYKTENKYDTPVSPHCFADPQCLHNGFGSQEISL